MKNLLKKQNGITLIALVITIIVLLILAGITIAMLSGENGILNRAQQTNMQNDYFQAEEKVKLAYMAVKTEIMTQKVQNSNYNAQNNAGKLGKIVRDELNGSEWTVSPDGTELTAFGTTINITYTKASLKQGGISQDPLHPRQNGEVNYEITLELQDATVNFDTDKNVFDGGSGAIDPVLPDLPVLSDLPAKLVLFDGTVKSLEGYTGKTWYEFATDPNNNES